MGKCLPAIVQTLAKRDLARHILESSCGGLLCPSTSASQNKTQQTLNISKRLLGKGPLADLGTPLLCHGRKGDAGFVERHSGSFEGLKELQHRSTEWSHSPRAGASTSHLCAEPVPFSTACRGLLTSAVKNPS